LNLPSYDTCIHPNEGVKQVYEYCFLNQITKDEEILKFAKIGIDVTINIPENITSLDELVNTLKQDVSFLIFKSTNKRKLRSLKYIPESKGGDTSKFILNFCKLCYNAEINDIEERKNYLYKSLPNVPNDYFLTEFFKRKERINSMNELIKEFDEIVDDESNLIKNGSIVTLKHVSTGKYLSSVDVLCYATGSYTQLVCPFYIINLYFVTLYKFFYND